MSTPPIGIDLGTTNSLIGYFSEDGPKLIPNAVGEFLTPSVVSLSDDGKNLLVGRAAQKRLVSKPELTKALFKRQMGTNSVLKLGKKSYSATELSAMVLSSLKQDAETELKVEICDVVISVPAYFNAVQRQATKDAAEIAGLNAIRLINEPTAAALANGVLDREDESTFVVLDLGGGTFDVSILEMFEGVMEVRASSGDAFLGGEDFTNVLAQHYCQKFALEWKALDAEDQEKLLEVAERTKRSLEGESEASATVQIGHDTQTLHLNTAKFDEVTAPLISRLHRPIEKSLYDSGTSPDQIDRVILVGGATRMPAVRSLAAKVFRKLPERKINPDHAIALGAAVQAGLVSKHEGLDDVVMTDVAPFSLGIETNYQDGTHSVAGAFAAIIERNTILPASRVQYFSTLGHNQTKIDVKIYQGESAIARENILLGEMLVPVPPKPAGEESIEVRFTYDVSGLLAVDVKVLSLDSTISQVIENLAGALSKSDKASRLKAMEKLKISPRDEAENVALIESLKHLYVMLLGSDRDYAMSLLGRFESAMATQDPKKIAAERTEIVQIVQQIEASFVQH